LKLPLLRRFWRNLASLGRRRSPGAVGDAICSAISDTQWQTTLAALPLLRGLSPQARQQLRQLSEAFLAQKSMHAAAGLELTDAMRLSIAAQACLPILALGLHCYDDWVGIVVYPGQFRVSRQEMDEFGVVHEFEDVLAGESWPGGPVVLSWEDVAQAGTGYNLVLHEFAHKLHMRAAHARGGDAEDFPLPLHPHRSQPYPRAADYQQQWRAAYACLCRYVERPVDRLANRPVDRFDRSVESAPPGSNATPTTALLRRIDPYAAEHPAEFFAVMSEVFFTDASLLARDWPDLYQLLMQFYCQDPAGI
jgi:Mlc titration factor MtfA (ptsG expression regulator)